jgi:hypothetical protein
LDEETFNSLLRLTAMFTITSVKAWQVRGMRRTQLYGCRLSSVSLLQRVPRSNGLDLDLKEWPQASAEQCCSLPTGQLFVRHLPVPGRLGSLNGPISSADPWHARGLQWTANSIEYLLTLWDKMASAMPMRTKQSQTPQIVDEFAPKVCMA